MTALRTVATATAQVLRMVADVIDPEPAYGEATSADDQWAALAGAFNRAYVRDIRREVERANRGFGHG